MFLLLFTAGALLGSFRATNVGQGLVTLAGIGGSVLLAARWFDRRPATGLGLDLKPAWWIHFAFGSLLGLVLMASIFGIELALGWVDVEGTLRAPDGRPFALPFLGTLFFFLCVGLTEELWMRGYVIPNISEAVRSRRITRRAAVIIALVFAAAVFGLLHIANPNASWVSTTGVIFAGIVLGLPFVWTGSLAIPVGLHFTWNAAQGLVFGFPVSGLSDFPSLLVIEQNGPDWGTGGEFGPEAGLLSVVVLFFGALAIYGWLSWYDGRPTLQTWLADPPHRSNDDEGALNVAKASDAGI